MGETLVGGRIEDSDSEDGWQEVGANDGATGPDFAAAFGLPLSVDGMDEPEATLAPAGAEAVLEQDSMEIDQVGSTADADRTTAVSLIQGPDRSTKEEADEKMKDETKRELDDLLCK